MAEDTGVVPQALKDKPDVGEYVGGVLHEFGFLSQARQAYEGGPQAIQIAEVLAYLEIAKIHDVEDRLLFLNNVKTLDVMYLNHYAEQQKK